MTPEEKFQLYVKQECDFARRRFGDEIAERWREQLFDNYEKAIAAIVEREKRGAYRGYYHWK